ncbi:uncharacterized protein TNCV_2749901 [Trichonephila clavipes]|nr:uncharacterized protein TNCV_2749901 [Trichonephila clavipes]
MNLPTPSQRFNKKESRLDTAVETVATVSIQIAGKEAKDVSGRSDIPVAIDGTWQKHGHTSLNGTVIVTSFYTGNVLDASILSRFCKCPNKMHNENCKADHFGNSGNLPLELADQSKLNVLENQWKQIFNIQLKDVFPSESELLNDGALY